MFKHYRSRPAPATEEGVRGLSRPAFIFILPKRGEKSNLFNFTGSTNVGEGAGEEEGEEEGGKKSPPHPGTI